MKHVFEDFVKTKHFKNNFSQRMEQQALNFINLEYLEMVTEGDKDLQKEMLGMVAAEVRAEIPKMRSCFENQDWTGLRDVSHKFKSTLSFVGNELMTEANKSVEDIAKSAADLEKLPGLLSLLESLQPKVSEELEKVYESL